MDEILINTSTLGSQDAACDHRLPRHAVRRGLGGPERRQHQGSDAVPGRERRPAASSWSTSRTSRTRSGKGRRSSRLRWVSPSPGTSRLPGGVPQLKLGPSTATRCPAPRSRSARPRSSRSSGRRWRVSATAGSSSSGLTSASRRAHPRATFRIGGRKGRPRVSRQHRRRAAPRSDGRRSDQRQHRRSGGARAYRAPLLVHFQIFDASGSPVGSEQTTDLDITHAAMAPLDSGRFVIAHIRQPGDGETGFDTIVAEASVFEASGAFAGTRFSATTGRIQTSWPAIVPLSGGRFVLGWTKSTSTRPLPARTSWRGCSRSPAARSAKPSGSTPRPAAVSGSACAPRRRPARTARTLFATWADNSQGAGDTSVRAVRGRPLPIPAGGF